MVMFEIHDLVKFAKYDDVHDDCDVWSAQCLKFYIIKIPVHFHPENIFVKKAECFMLKYKA